MTIISEMEKKKNTTVVAQDADNTSTLPARINPFASAFELAEQSDMNEEITSEYKLFEQGVMERLCYAGTREIENYNGTGKTTAVILYDEPGNKFINADSMVVSTLTGIGTVPCVVDITCTGEKKSKNGTYKTFSIIQKTK